MSINYSAKVNKRSTGNELHIFNEPHTVGIVGVDTVLANMIKLVEVPRMDTPTSTVLIPGFMEVSTTPLAGQFLVNYQNGYITFNNVNNGASVLVTYYGRGSEIDAVDINELQGPVGIALTIDGEITPANLSSDPLSPQVGQIYFNTISGQWVGWNGTNWVLLG